MIAAMKQALEALEVMKAGHCAEEKIYINNVIAALRQAIAQAEKQKALDKKADNARELGLGYKPEPVAYIDHVSGKPKFINGYVVQTDYDIPLYTAPPQAEKQEPVNGYTTSQVHGYTAPPRKEWVGLTDEEIDKAIISTAPSFKPDDVARAIEAKLKEKNT